MKNKFKFCIYTPKKCFRKYFKKEKLVMTLLVRDEADIVEENIKFHLKHGVDFIIATDNGSIDGTRDILKKYERKGILHLIDEPSQDYSQAVWVNKMGKIAFEEFGADFIFHCDADEFWHSKSGDLKKEINNSNCNILMIDVINVLPCYDGGNEKFPNDTKYAVINSIISNNLEMDSKQNSLYLFKYPPKVFLKKYYDAIQGNHDIVQKNVKKCNSNDIVIYHYPLRSKEHFFTKVKNGGQSYKDNKNLSKSIGWHWRRWFDAYNNGSLDEEYKKLILSKKNVRELTEENIIKVVEFNDVIK
jgi:hypothetical protein